jgi:S1-C subfamily serine protease
MKRLLLSAALMLTFALVPAKRAMTQTDVSFTKIGEEVNRKVVKVFGAGGFKGLASYGTGVLISKDGYFLTVNSHILDTRDLRIHTYEGT